VAQAVEFQLYKCRTLSSNPSPTKKKERKKERKKSVIGKGLVTVDPARNS
jgi:hypothetical protein